MATQKQKTAARRNVKKASQKRKGVAPSKGRAHPVRKKPGELGSGEFYRIELAPASRFVEFRNHDVGRRGSNERVAGRKEDGTWETQAWLIHKKNAHVRNGKIVPHDAKTREILEKLGAQPRHSKGDIFKARARRRTGSEIVNAQSIRRDAWGIPA
jgi:hypothetical protein